MEEMKEFLRDASLSMYSGIFEDMGYDCLDHLLNMTSENLLELKQLVNMKQGHFVRMKATITNWRVPVTPSTSSTPSTPTSSVSMAPSPQLDTVADEGPHEMGPHEVGPHEMGPHEMGPHEMGPDPSTDGPINASPSQLTPKAQKPSLRQAYKKWSQARLASLQHSTKSGCSAMLDNKASGGRRKVLRCRTALSKKKKNTADNAEEDEDDRPNCPHMLLWTKDCQGVWTLNQEKSITHHRPFCNSGQIVTKFELLRDPEFVKAQKLGKLSTGKEAAKLALGLGGRMSGSVKEHTARRARNTLKHYDLNDYDDDWSKLNEWGHKYMELNPESRFHLEKDESNGLVYWAHIVCGPKLMYWAHIVCGPKLMYWAHIVCGPVCGPKLIYCL